MKIRALKRCCASAVWLDPGQEAEVSRQDGIILCRLGQAELIEDGHPLAVESTAAAVETPEKASRRRRAKPAPEPDAGSGDGE